MRFQPIGQCLCAHITGPFARDVEVGDPAPEMAAHPDTAFLKAPIFKRLNHDLHQLSVGKLRRRLFRVQIEVAKLAFPRSTSHGQHTHCQSQHQRGLHKQSIHRFLRSLGRFRVTVAQSTQVVDQRQLGRKGTRE